MPRPPHQLRLPPYRAARSAAAMAGAPAVLALAVSPAMAFDTNADADVITETIASGERAKDWDHSSKYGSGTVAAHPTGPGEAEGLRYGSFKFFPSALAKATWDDNIFRSGVDKQSDVRFVLLPAVKVVSDLPRHILDLEVSGKLVEYAEHTDQNYENVRASVSGGLHFDHAHTLSIGLASELSHDEKGMTLTPTDTAVPVPYLHNRASLGLTRDVGRLYGTVFATADSYDYEDVTDVSGNPLDQDYRDNEQLTGGVRVGYRFSPGFDFVTKLRAIRILNEGNEDKSTQSSGWEATAGIRFQTSTLLRWHLLGGYGVRDYDRADMDTVGSSLIEGRLEWVPTERTTVTGAISREIQNDPNDEERSGGVIETELRGRIDYAIYNNLVAHAGMSWAEADFLSSDRRDDTFGAEIGLDYYYTKNWQFTLGYDFELQDSNDPDYDFTRNRVTVGAKLKF